MCILNKKLLFSALYFILLLPVLFAQSLHKATPSLQEELTSNLPIILIETLEEIKDDPKVYGYMKIIDNGTGELNHSTDSAKDYAGHIGIEIRGQSSQMFPKKSYAVETRDSLGDNLNVSLLGMPTENDWVLYGPYSDKSMLRNYLSFYMARQLRTYASRTRFCEVIVNDDYKGVYILMEKIKKDDDRVSIANLTPEDLSGDELTGGYIIKVDKIDPDFNYRYDGWVSFPDPPFPNAKNITFQYVYPDPDGPHPTQRRYIREFVTSFENNLTSSGFSNPYTGYQAFINTTSFADQMLLNEVSKEVDKYRYSTYFYKEKITDGGKLFAGPPWDFNLGYSNVDYYWPVTQYDGWLYENVQPMESGIMFWWKRLMQSYYFKSLAYTRYWTLRQGPWSDQALQHQIDSIAYLLKDAQVRNYERWPILGEYVWPNFDWEGNNYQDEVAFLSEWLFNRLNWMDNNLDGVMLYPEAELSGFFPLVTIDLSQDYFARPSLKPKFFTLRGDTVGLTIDTVFFESTRSIKLMLSGIAKKTSEISVVIENKVLNSYQNLETNSLILGQEDLMIANAIRVFNTDQHIHILCENPLQLEKTVRVYSINGQQVLVEKLAQQERNRIKAPQPGGIYMVQLSYQGKTQSFKILVTDY